MAFLDDSYLLKGQTARNLFAAVKGLPVVDPHNHANTQEIAANANYPDLWQLFAGTDHYVWSVMRKCGVAEDYITGAATSKEKWLKLAAIFPRVAGNPVYEWVHLDLRRGLGIDSVIDARSAEAIWDLGNRILAKDSMRPQALLGKMNVEVMCSTDDPVDLLEGHGVINAAAGRRLVRPTWRPDKAMNIFKPDWRDYVKKLQRRFTAEFKSIDDLLQALQTSHDYFQGKGCRASDHAVVTPLSGAASPKKAGKAFKKAFLDKAPLDPDEQEAFMSHLMGEMAEMNAKSGWVTQIHIGAVRDVRDSIASSLGPDSGGDVSDHFIDILPPLRSFLNRFDGRLKVVLYCLDPSHQQTLTTLSHIYDHNVRLGSAWWLLDTPVGMRRQLEYIGSVELLSNFAGMVSDSRKLLSYQSRFEVFRRVLCDTVAAMVDHGQMPHDVAETLVKNICYDNPKGFFGI